MELKESKQGLLIKIYARAGVRKNQVSSFRDGLKVSVTTSPQKGKANEAILDLLADVLDLKKQQLSILHGQTSQQKTVLIQNVSKDELLEKVSDTFS